MGINAIIGQSGGPTSVINASLAGVFSACRAHGVPTVYGMRFGVQGLLQDNLVNLTDALSAPGALDLLRHTPASYLGSCRFKLPPSARAKTSTAHCLMFCTAMISAISFMSAVTTAWIPFSS